MKRTLSRTVLTFALAGLTVGLAAPAATAAASDRAEARPPKLTAAPIPGTSSISVSADRLTPSDRIELTLPRGLGEANGLEHQWDREALPDGDQERWTFSGSNSSSTALALDVMGMEPGERGLLSIFSTDPETGDELQGHWWLVAGEGEVILLPAGAARIEKMVRLTMGPEVPETWKSMPRDDAGRLLLRQSDPRLAEVLPWSVRQEPFVRAQSISAEAAGGSVTVSTTWNMEFTNYVCESWIGLILQVTTAPADAVITTFDVSYTVYHSVDTSRYKSSVSRRPNGITWLNTVSLYNGTYSGHNWHTRSLNGLPDWAGYPVNFDYVLGVCNLYGAEYAYLDQWSLTLYYNTGGGGGGSVDLVADDVRTDFDTVAAGGQLGYYYDAHVGGSGGVGSSFSTGVYLSSDAGISTSDTLLQTVPESSTLAAGDQFGARVFSRQVIVPASVAPGTYWVGVILDNSDAVTETNEGNNTASRQITVVGSSSKPNLKVSGCSVSPDHANSGGTVQLSYRAQNTGSTGAAYFSYGIFISTDQTFDGSDQVVSGLDVPGGWAAGYDSGTQTVTVPLGNLADGTYYLGYMADVGNQVPETNENDNFCVAQLTVGSGGGGGGVTHWMIAAAASLTGLNSANWKTQVSIVNPDSVSHTVNLYYVARGAGWPGVLLSGPINLSPNHAWFSDDPLAGLRPTSGMMYVVADSPGPVVTTRTYNDVAGVGRFGQGIAAQAIGSSPASELVLPMAHSGTGQYHANLGLVQADSGSFTVEVSIYSSGGSLLATKSYTRSGAFDQITDIFNDMGLGGAVVSGAWIRVKLTSGSPAYWTTYLSLIDETTGDPTYIAPVAP